MLYEEWNEETPAQPSGGIEITAISSKMEMRLEDIQACEQKILARIQYLFHDIEPSVVVQLLAEKDNIRDIYGMGHFGHCFINDYHAFNIQIVAGKQNGENVEEIGFYSLSGSDFEDAFIKADLAEFFGQQIDSQRIDMYQAIHRMVGTFNQEMEKILVKYDVDPDIEESEEVSVYRIKEEEGKLRDLLEMPYATSWDVTINYLEENASHREAEFKKAVAQFADQFEFLEPQYDQLRLKYGAQNSFVVQ